MKRLHSQPEGHSAPTQSALPDAAELIAPHGRVTPARVRVLHALLAAPSTLSHQDLERLLGGEIDRVTLYRVLDWLLAKGLAHRLAGDDRLWRFSANRQTSMGHEHAHFHCRGCGRWYCLEELQPVYALSLPAGFRLEQAELTVRGLCSACSA